ncbi:uncharacterized protein LOC118436745 isoform X1 [Folsomia candida]|uniref:uncharacterized protein LOC118435534 isoform X1 n=1 Tax=Folsomia candida TaxID=158441 RepID=UPI001604CDA4|nr:uncharacterized protein LOC118435534 isoform X1 [Folsomia candida]XP_035711222.1 uncharacterized protein LOC118436745 isoform X1 [Folsomia candida]
MRFSIVNFIETNEIEIIPINWLSPSRDKCWWPPFKSTERQLKAAMGGDNPSKQWLSFDVKVVGGGKIFGESPFYCSREKYLQNKFIFYSESYQQAKSQLGKALDETEPEFESDFEVTGRGQRHKKSQRQEESSDSEREDGLTKIPSKPNFSIPPPPQYFALVGGISQRSDRQDDHESGSSIHLPRHSPPVSDSHSQQENEEITSRSANSLTFNKLHSPSPHGQMRDLSPNNMLRQHCTGELVNVSSNHSVEIDTQVEINQEISANIEFQNWMVRQMNVVKAQLRQLQECVDALLNSCNLNGQGGGQSLNTLPAGLLPVDCDSDLKKLEDFATESRNTLIRELQRGLGATKTAQKATQRILSKLLTDTYASSYNWIGSRGEKTAFSKSLMKHIIFEAIHGIPKLSDAGDDEISNAIKDWLKNSNKRIESDRKRLAKSNANHPSVIAGFNSDD